MEEPKVYIVQDNPDHSFWPAEPYGKLKHCLPQRADMKKTERIVPLLRIALQDFTQDDYLLISGAPIAVGVAFAILHEKFDTLNVLRWSSMMQNYEHVKLDLMQLSLENGNGN